MADKLFALGTVAKGGTVHGVKKSQLFIQIKASLGLEIIASWGSLPIGMVLQSEGSLISEMLSGTGIKIREQYYM